MERYLYSKEQIIERFIYVISNNDEHRLRKHCIDIAKFWKAMATGQGQECFVLSYRIRESEPQKKQRIRLHVPESVAIMNQIRSTIKEINRTDNYIDCFEADEKIKIDIQENIDSFRGEEELEEYFSDITINLNEWDPNAFSLIDHYEFDPATENAHCYPNVIYTCPPELITKEVQLKDGTYKEDKSFTQSHANWRDWEEYNNTLQYLIFDDKERIIISTEKGPQSVEAQVHYCYAKGISAKLTMVPDGYDYNTHLEESNAETKQLVSLQGIGTINYTFANGEAVPISAGTSEQKYILEVWDTKTNKVPFKRVGFFKDPQTNGEVYESMYYGAKLKFLDLARKKGELDVTIATKGFIKSLQYVPSCSHQDPESPENFCDRGTMSVSRTKCGKCNGSGKKGLFHTTPQDLVTFDLVYTEPGRKEDLLDLSTLHHDVQIPKECIAMVKTLVDECKVDISKAIFNTNIFIRGTLASTSPDAIKAMLDPVNNVLHEVAECKARLMRHAILCIADYKDYNGKVEWSRKNPSDYQLENIGELLAQRKSAEGSPSAVINAIDAKILKKLNKDDPAVLHKIMCKESFRPFAGLSQADKISKQSMLPELDDKRIMCIYFDDIFRVIDTDKKYMKFYESDNKQAMLDEVIEIFRQKYLASKGGNDVKLNIGLSEEE